MQQCLKKMPAEAIKAKFSPGEKQTINQKYANDEPRCNNAWKNCPPNRLRQNSPRAKNEPLRCNKDMQWKCATKIGHADLLYRYEPKKYAMMLCDATMLGKIARRSD